MNAVRHSNRNATMMKITSSTPISSAVVRLSIDCSMNVAGRKIVVSMSIPGSPGRSSSTACSTPSVTSIVLAPRNFWTISSRPSPSLTTLAPRRLVVLATVPRSASRSTRPLAVHDRHLAELLGPTIGCTCRTFIRWPRASTNPPVPSDELSVRTAAPRRRRRWRWSPSARSRETPFWRQLSRIDLHVALLQALAVDVHGRHARAPAGGAA